VIASSRGILVSLLALLAATWAGGARAQNTPAIRIASEAGAARELQLEMGQNRLLVLSDEIVRVAVAEPRVADLKVVTPNQILLTAKGVGATDLTLWNRSNQPLVISLQVSKNLDRLRQQLKELFPNEKVTALAAGEMVVLSGQVSDLRVPERMTDVAKLHATQVANLVQVSGNQQVQLEVKFAEVSRSGLREIGVNWFMSSNDGRQVGGITGRGGNGYIVPPNPTGVNPAPPPIPGPQFNNAFNIFFSNAWNLPFSVMLNLLETNNLAKVLAEPSLVTLTGQEARFLAGGQIPVPMTSTLGQANVEWKNFGIMLNFTPTVISENTIHLKLYTEVSDLDPSLGTVVGGIAIPGLISRQSETTVRLGNGQSFAIAGLLSDKVRSSVQKVPGLGSIPILGALFRSSAFERQETELVIVITARLAQPVAPHQIPPLPTAYEVNDPDDFSFYLLGSDGSQVDNPKRPWPVSASGGGPAGQSGYVK
jgi:pilus assembly protein CpaC